MWSLLLTTSGTVQAYPVCSTLLRCQSPPPNPPPLDLDLLDFDLSFPYFLMSSSFACSNISSKEREALGITDTEKWPLTFLYLQLPNVTFRRLEDQHPKYVLEFVLVACICCVVVLVYCDQIMQILSSHPKYLNTVIAATLASHATLHIRIGTRKWYHVALLYERSNICAQPPLTEAENGLGRMTSGEKGGVDQYLW